MTPIISLRLFSQLCFIITSLAALVSCPHSKVEESFQLQATHDLFYYGIGPALASMTTNSSQQQQQEPTVLPYDHLQYPGVVPRTFLGPFLLAYSLQAIRWLLFPMLDLATYPMIVQFLARFLLWLVHIRAWFQLANAVDVFVASMSLSKPKDSATKNNNNNNNNNNHHHHHHHQLIQTQDGQRRHDSSTLIGSYLLLTTASQFHIPFYASRMLPNTFALILVLYCYAAWFRQEPSWAAVWLVFATAVVRCDLLLLLFTVGLSWLFWTRQLTIVQAIRIGIITGVISLLITTPLDSLLWKLGQAWIWPEGHVLWFNTVLNKSKEWGVLPWHWYISSAIPKAMLATLFLVPLSFVRFHRSGMFPPSPPRLQQRIWQHQPILQYLDTTWLPYLLPIGAFIGLYSLLGHKEMRFIFPAMPMLNLAAAIGLSNLHRISSLRNDDDDKEYDEYAKSKKHDNDPTPQSLTGKLKSRLLPVWMSRINLWSCGIMALVVTALGSVTFVAVSTWNYPGGVALSRLIRHIIGSIPASKEGVIVKVHVDVASAMSGVSLFGQREAVMNSARKGRNERWTFEKGGYEEEHALPDFSRFTHLLSEQPHVQGFHIVEAVQGKPRLDIRRLRIATEDAIYILERNG